VKMLNYKLKCFLFLIIVCLAFETGFDSIKNKEERQAEERSEKLLPNSSDLVVQENSVNLILARDTIEVIVFQCANGYEYSMHEYDFNPIIEKDLNKLEGIIVKPFPLKKLKGAAYQGVFDKKYCAPIIEKADADYLILTRFDKEFDALNRDTKSWGYEVRIVNTES